jgi:hypothetical protein
MHQKLANRQKIAYFLVNKTYAAGTGVFHTGPCNPLEGSCTGISAMSQKNRGLAAHLAGIPLLLVLACGATLLLADPAEARGFRHGFYWGVGVGYWGPWWPGYWGGWPYYPYYPYDYDYGYPAATSVTVVQQPPANAAPPAYYYCDAPAGYYPYVASCSKPWRQVPVTPR